MSAAADSKSTPRSPGAGLSRASFRRGLAGSFVVITGLSLGCAPTVNILGTYFPPSLVSALIGLTVSYGIVRSLASRPSLRALAQSALFFGSLAVITSYIAWWGLFSDF